MVSKYPVTSKFFRRADSLTVAAAKPFSQTTRRQLNQPGTSADQQVSNKSRPRCSFCGLKQHPRSKYPTKIETSNKCSKAGHWASVCRSTAAVLQQSFDDELEFAAVLCSDGLPPANLNISLKFIGSNEPDQAIFDTGSFYQRLNSCQLWSEGPSETQSNYFGKWRLPCYVRYRWSEIWGNPKDLPSYLHCRKTPCCGCCSRGWRSSTTWLCQTGVRRWSIRDCCVPGPVNWWFRKLKSPLRPHCPVQCTVQNQS